MERSSMNSKFLSLCMASAARQLDCSSLKDIQDVFQKLDVNHDGAIDLEELKKGLEQTHGVDSEQASNVSRMFEQLDLDSSGSIDYTEFCAAALGEKMLEQENILWMAFKTFDVKSDDDKVHIEEISNVLNKSNVRVAWRPEVCDAVAKEIMEMFDTNDVGYLDFDAWVKMMRNVAWPAEPPEDSGTISMSDTGGISISAPLASKISVASRPQLLGIAWVSLDPRSGHILAYPAEISRLIEAHYQLGHEDANLGPKFYNARVYYRSANGLPFQKTASGVRDVRRLEIMDGMREVEFLVGGELGEYRLTLDGTTKQLSHGASANVVTSREVQDKMNDIERNIATL